PWPVCLGCPTPQCAFIADRLLPPRFGSGGTIVARPYPGYPRRGPSTARRSAGRIVATVPTVAWLLVEDWRQVSAEDEDPALCVYPGQAGEIRHVRRHWLGLTGTGGTCRGGATDSGSRHLGHVPSRAPTKRQQRAGGY